MQTTLLGLGIAVILALVAALVGPLIIDWTQYRTAIEAEASRIVGAPVRVAGPLQVGLLPVPYLDLKAVEIAPAGSTKLAARRLTMEFGLGTLLRGEFRATEATIDGAEVAIGLDPSGHIDLPAARPGFDLDRIAIDRLTLGNSRITFTDASSGARLGLDHVELTGEARSLLGPFAAKGSFAANGEHFNFSLFASRRGDNGGMKLRLAVDALERALAFESDGTLWIEGRAPRYEGAAALSRVVGAALPGGRVAINDPWRVTGKLTANTAAAAVKELDLQYGRDVRSFHMAGAVQMNFGPEPRIAGDVSARQIDLDRVLGGSEGKRLPFDLVRSLAESLADWGAPSVPVRVGVGVDGVTVGGATLTGVRGDIQHTAGGWNVDNLELRAPGATVLHVAGKLAMADRNVAFDGPVKVDSTDPAAFFAWAEGQSAAGRPSLGPMHATGTVTLSGERIAVEGLLAEINREPLEGRLAYRFATAAQPARLDATLRAAELDFDRGIAAGNALFALTAFDRPGEVALAIDVAHAVYSGIEARQTHAALTYDSAGLKIERLSVGDIGGASIEASGRIDGIGDAARGSIALTLAAPRLDAATVLADKFLPRASEMLGKYGSRVLPLRVTAKLDVEPRPGNPGTSATPGNLATPGSASSARTAAKLKLNGKIAGIDIDLDAAGTGDITDPAAATVRLDGRLVAAEARKLAALIGLDALVSADAKPARATFTMEGAADRGFKVDGKFAGADVTASAAGTLSPSGSGVLDAALRAADARLLRRSPGGAVPVDLKSRVSFDVPSDLQSDVAIAATTVTLGGLSGKLAGANVKGDLALGIARPVKIDGRIEADQVDAAALTALFTGTPQPQSPARSGRGPALEWPAEPFAPAAVPALEGRIEFRAGAARWAALTARQLSGSARFGPEGLSLSDVTGTLADGRLALDASFRRDAMGLELTSRVKLVNADLPVLLAGALRVPAVGRISLDAEARGQGLSAASLLGSLTGTGTVTAEQVEIAGLDPTAMDAVIGALERDRALASNPGRVNDIANAGLDRGRLRLPFAAAALTITDGRALLTDFAAPAQNADIAGALSLGLNDAAVDLRLEMTGPQRANAPGPEPGPGERPHMGVAVRGPLTAARRSADAAALANWVMLQRVDQDAKRLDEVDKQQRRIEAAAAVVRRPADATTAPVRRTQPQVPPPSQALPAQQQQQPYLQLPPFNLPDLFHGTPR